MRAVVVGAVMTVGYSAGCPAQQVWSVKSLVLSLDLTEHVITLWGAKPVCERQPHVYYRYLRAPIQSTSVICAHFTLHSVSDEFPTEQRVHTRSRPCQTTEHSSYQLGLPKTKIVFHTSSAKLKRKTHLLPTTHASAVILSIV